MPLDGLEQRGLEDDGMPGDAPVGRAGAERSAALLATALSMAAAVISGWSPRLTTMASLSASTSSPSFRDADCPRPWSFADQRRGPGRSTCSRISAASAPRTQATEASFASAIAPNS